MAAPKRPALRYFGGKWKIGPWIIEHFPPHTCYCEPYGGGASVLLRKTPAFCEVYNDTYNDVVSFFRILRDRPADLITAIDLTPYSRTEMHRAHEATDDPLEKARRLYVRSWQAWGRIVIDDNASWRYSHSDKRGKTTVHDWNNSGHLWAVVRRLKQVQIECDDALKIIARYDTPETLFYVDPPYPQSTRSKKWANNVYANEMTDDDHRELAGVLHNIEGMAIISGYPCELYDELYRDWTTVQKEAYTDAGPHGRRKTIERLWISPNVQSARSPLFEWRFLS